MSLVTLSIAEISNESSYASYYCERESTSELLMLNFHFHMVTPVVKTEICFRNHRVLELRKPCLVHIQKSSASKTLITWPERNVNCAKV